jgi:hypothetical protein
MWVRFRGVGVTLQCNGVGMGICNMRCWALVNAKASCMFSKERTVETDLLKQESVLGGQLNGDPLAKES